MDDKVAAAHAASPSAVAVLAGAVLLHLVRHGRPLVDPSVPPRVWPLDPAGLADLEALRAALPTSATEADWFSSDERKALDTARRLTDLPVQQVPELREAERSSFVDDRAAFVTAVSRGLQHPFEAALPGWEPLETTRQRVTDAVVAIISESHGNVVLVGHGTAWTLLVSHLVGEPLPRELPLTAMPDLLILDLSSRIVVHPWGHRPTQRPQEHEDTHEDR